MGYVFTTGIKSLTNGSTNWGTTELQVLLVNNGYTFDADHDFVNYLSTYECNNTGYTRMPLTTMSIDVDDTNNEVQYDAADVTFASLGAGKLPFAAVVYKYAAADNSAQLFAYCNLVSPPSPNGGDYTIVWSGEGIFKISN